MTHGMTMSQILFCTDKCIIADYCPHFKSLVNIERYGSSVPRCLPEELMYDAIIHEFKEEYELDDVADQIMLNSLAMSIVRYERGQKILAAQGELTDRVKRFADGSVETYQTPNAISSVIDSLDKRAAAWLRELKVSKAAREGTTVTKNINLINMLSSDSDSNVKDKIIDAELEDEL